MLGAIVKLKYSGFFFFILKKKKLCKEQAKESFHKFKSYVSLSWYLVIISFKHFRSLKIREYLYNFQVVIVMFLDMLTKYLINAN